jgi:hypothetical protein
MHGKLLGHLRVAEGSDTQSLRQVTPHPLRTDYGLAQPGNPSLEKGKLLNLFMTLPLRLLPPLLSIGHYI